MLQEVNRLTRLWLAGTTRLTSTVMERCRTHCSIHTKTSQCAVQRQQSASRETARLLSRREMHEESHAWSVTSGGYITEAVMLQLTLTVFWLRGLTKACSFSCFPE